MLFIKKILFLCSFAGIFSLHVNVDEKIETIVDYYLGKEDRRFKTFTVALQLAIERKAKTFIETGTCRTLPSNCRKEGCSTYIFSAFNQLLSDESVEIYSVDISEKNCQNSRENIKSFEKYAVKVITSDSVKFIQDWPTEKKIDFLYLDSFDFGRGKEIKSQEHHLKELMAALEKIHNGTIILMDDCKLRMGGKCAMVKDYLLKNNWNIVIDEYQTLFVKNEH